MTEQTLVFGTRVNEYVFYRIALTVENTLERIVHITYGMPRITVGMIFIAHVNITGHEENNVFCFATCSDIFLERLKVVKTVYTVEASLNAVSSA